MKDVVDNRSSFNELLNKDISATPHYTSTRALTTEINKATHHSSQGTISESFQLRDNRHYNLRYAYIR